MSMHKLGKLDVSRETIERLEHYAELLAKWNPRINLISAGDLGVLWERHFIDSAQVFVAGNATDGAWADLGSGGGFPGLVVAILSKDFGRKTTVTLVESDARKAVFLRTAARETGVDVDVLNRRIEKIEPLNAGIVSARALADLDTLFGYCEMHLAEDGLGVFPKGRTWQDEIRKAKLRWSFEYEAIKSRTDEDSVVLRIERLVRVKS